MATKAGVLWAADQDAQVIVPRTTARCRHCRVRLFSVPFVTAAEAELVKKHLRRRHPEVRTSDLLEFQGGCLEHIALDMRRPVGPVVPTVPHGR